MSSRLKNRLIALGTAAAAGLSLALVPAAQPASAYTAFELQHAGATFGWYPVASRYEFKGAIPSAFKKSGKGGYRIGNGMLTIVANKNARINTTWKRAARTGRWETRFRTDQMREGSRGTDYTVQIAMIPAAATAAHCGAQQIKLLSYRPAKPRTTQFQINTLPTHRFTKDVRSGRPIGDDQWHTIAVEVRPNRISFYLDAKVVAKETRPNALLDVPLKMQFSLIPVANKMMRTTRLNLDWARYWTLRKAGKHQDAVRKAPPMTYTTNRDAC